MRLIKKHHIFLIAFIFGLGLFQVEAQYRKNRSSVTGSKFRPKVKRKKPRNYINSIKGDLMLGYATYSGDLCDGMDCFDPQIATTLGLTYRMTESLSLRAGLSWFRLAGDDSKSEDVWRKRRNLHFRSENIEFAVVAKYNIFQYHKMYRRRQTFSPYVFLGVGANYFIPKAELEVEGSTDWYNLRDYKTEGEEYSKIAFVIPYGAGITVKVSPHLDLLIDVGFRLAFTDYLDDVSNSYAIQSELSSVGKALSDRTNEYDGFAVSTVDRSNKLRGGADKRDGYYMTRIGLSYTLKVTKQSYNINSNVSRLRIIKSIKRK